jgi:hypothetical protein
MILSVDNVMKPLSWDNKQLGLASPLQSAASQSGQPTNHPCENERAGCKSPHPHLSEGRGEVFFLTSSFIRRVKWPVAVEKKPKQKFRL